MAHNAEINSRRNWGLDLMRALAILMVLYGHFGEHMPKDTIYQHVIYFGGMLGVELFFVLSGFLIGGILLHEIQNDKIFSLKGVTNFWVRRWYRTLPLFILFFLYEYITHKEAKPNDIWQTLTFTTCIPYGKNISFMGVTWSLAIEEWFYLLFPIAIFFIGKVNKRISALGSIVAIVVGSLIFRHNIYQVTPISWEWIETMFRKSTFARIDAIAIGVLFVYIQKRIPYIWQLMINNRIILWLPCFLMLYFLFSCSVSNQWILNRAVYENWSLWMSIPCALMLPMFYNMRTVNGLAGTAISYIAKISYSLYLAHIPAIILLNKLFGVIWDQQNTKHDWMMPLYFIGAILLSTVTYFCWEEPWIKMRDKGAWRNLYRKIASSSFYKNHTRKSFINFIKPIVCIMIVALLVNADKNYTDHPLFPQTVEQRANAGDVNSMTELAFQFANDHDSSKATYWFAKAANKGDQRSALQLAEIYLSDKNGVFDANAAIYWLTQAANNGSINAARRLSILYVDGKITPPNLELSQYWQMQENKNKTKNKISP